MYLFKKSGFRLMESARTGSDGRDSGISRSGTGLPSPRAVRRQWLVAPLLLTLAAGAHAQFTSQNQALGQPEQVSDVLTFEAGLDISRHDNIFLLREEAVVPAIYGDSKRGDTLITGLFGVKFDRDVSLQRFTVTGRILPTKYLTYSQFDYVGYDLGANWNWAIGRPWFGTLGVALGQRASAFSEVQNINDSNLQKSTRLYFTGGLRLTPSWALIAGVDNLQSDNSVASQQPSDYDFTGLEVGAKYAPGSGTELDFVYRTTDGKYPNRQVTDSLGNLLGAAVDNGFQQNEFLVRMTYLPNEDARLTGQIGFTERSFDNLPARDFSGPTARLNYDWRPGGRFFMGAELVRDIYSEEILTSSYVDTRRVALRPSLRLTGKISLNGTISYSQLLYEGDPGFVASNADVREDKLTVLGLRLDWQYSRNVLFNLDYRRIDRKSNYQQAEYADNVIGLGAKINF